MSDQASPDVDDPDMPTPVVSPLQEVPPSVHPKSLRLTEAFAKLHFDETPVEGSCLSPTSPSSVFNKCTLVGSKGCLVNAIVLCNWDNILGPKIRYLWTNEEPDGLQLETLNNIASHTLSGEICRDPTDSRVDTKLYVIKEKNIAVTAYVFGAMGLSDLAVHSLSLIVSHSELKRFLHLNELCHCWLTRLIGKLRLLLEKVS